MFTYVTLLVLSVACIYYGREIHFGLFMPNYFCSWVFLCFTSKGTFGMQERNEISFLSHVWYTYGKGIDHFHENVIPSTRDSSHSLGLQKFPCGREFFLYFFVLCNFVWFFSYHFFLFFLLIKAQRHLHHLILWSPPSSLALSLGLQRSPTLPYLASPHSGMRSHILTVPEGSLRL